MQKDLKAEPHLPGGEDEEGLGLENATLKWNEVVHVEKREEQDKAKNGVLSPSASSDIPSPTSSNDDVETVAASDVGTGASDSESLTAGLETDYKFELRDTTVRFPEGQLSVITGPTVSGETALLVRRRVPPLSALSFSLVQYPDGAARRDDSTTRKDRHLQQHIKDRREWRYLHAISCAARSPWQSVKDNILFGYPLMRSGIIPSWSVAL